MDGDDSERFRYPDGGSSDRSLKTRLGLLQYPVRLSQGLAHLFMLALLTRQLGALLNYGSQN